MLRHHGDVEARPGMLDFAVNVRGVAPPAWLRARLAERLDDLGRYPSAEDEAAARAAVAARHGRDPEEVLLLAGAAEGFAMLPRLAPRLAAVVHPSFTEPELALREAGVPVTRVILDRPYTLDPTLVPEDADLVVLGNPTNPTSVLHPAATIEALRRPGRLVVVDEAFADAVADPGGLTAAPGRPAGLEPPISRSGLADPAAAGGPATQSGAAGPWPTIPASAGPASAGPASAGPASAGPVSAGPASAGAVSASAASAGAASAGAVSAGPLSPAEPESLASLSAPDVLVLRSLTKTWALAGLRCGYALGAPEVLARLSQGRPHWPLGTLQLEAIIATAAPAAVAESRREADRIAVERAAMIERLTALGVDVHTPATGPFLLLAVRDGALVRKHLADRGIAVRRADTFPGLGPDHLRVAVRGPAEVDKLIEGLRAALW
ncbi:aminotransferase class I/II-fold pyridoxal phosphate-dependent enzyme [Nocardia asteroides]|nr:pyridoxal phosphate-dependent aminotransferase [Nocardia asteroides]UGT58701.1 aminotransferase class I/II-fold pyridoxal phosphate-dependent enzyme [Nocardia asteroides]